MLYHQLKAQITLQHSAENTPEVKALEQALALTPDDLALKMELAIKEKKYSGIKGRVFAEQFKEDTILDQYEKLYLKVLG